MTARSGSRSGWMILLIDVRVTAIRAAIVAVGAAAPVLLLTWLAITSTSEAIQAVLVCTLGCSVGITPASVVEGAVFRWRPGRLRTAAFALSFLGSTAAFAVGCVQGVFAASLLSGESLADTFELLAGVTSVGTWPAVLAASATFGGAVALVTTGRVTHGDDDTVHGALLWVLCGCPVVALAIAVVIGVVTASPVALVGCFVALSLIVLIAGLMLIVACSFAEWLDRRYFAKSARAR